MCVLIYLYKRTYRTFASPHCHVGARGFKPHSTDPLLVVLNANFRQKLKMTLRVLLKFTPDFLISLKVRQNKWWLAPIILKQHLRPSLPERPLLLLPCPWWIKLWQHIHRACVGSSSSSRHPNEIINWFLCAVLDLL